MFAFLWYKVRVSSYLSDMCISVADENSSAGVVKESLARIKGSFATLVTKTTDKLKRKDIDISAVRLCIVTLFPPGDIVSDASSVVEVCEALSRHQLWDYNNYLPIKNIAETFAGDDPELKGWISDYKSELSGFKATTKIANFIKESISEEEDIADPEQSIQQDKARYDKRYCRKLTAKLKARVTEETLNYVDQFWMSIADHFIIQPLSVLLDSIHEGCVEMTWYIPTLSALQIQTNIQDSREFFQKLEVSRLTLDDEVLYDEGMSEVKIFWSISYS